MKTFIELFILVFKFNNPHSSIFNTFPGFIYDFVVFIFYIIKPSRSCFHNSILKCHILDQIILLF